MGRVWVCILIYYKVYYNVMKDKELKFEEIEVSQTLGGSVTHLDSSVSRT